MYKTLIQNYNDKSYNVYNNNITANNHYHNQKTNNDNI